jgi:type IV pilus assembly protein PilM
MSRLTSLFAPSAPTVGIEIASGRVTVVRLASGGSPATIAAAAVEPLPPGAVIPALNDTNITDPSVVVEALRRALDRASGRLKRGVLVVPDTAAKVSLLRFEKVPPRASDLAELVRWQVRKTVPFRVEDAQLTFAPTASAVDGSGEFAVVLARRDVIAEYEAVCQDAGVQVGVVDLATFNLINAVTAAGSAPQGDWLLVNAAGEYLSVAILRGSELLFFRHRGSEGEGSLADVVHQTAMYYEDRLQGRGFTRVVLAGVSHAAVEARPGMEIVDHDHVRQQLEGRLRVRVDAVDPRPAVTLADRITVDPALLDTLAPAVGLLLRERAA